MEYMIAGIGGGLVGAIYVAWRLKQGTNATWLGIVKALGGGPGPFVPPE